MDCDICMRGFGGRIQPLCITCAHTALYGPRIHQAHALVECEKSHRHADAVIRPGNDGVLAALPDDVDFDAITAGMKKHSHDRAQAQRLATDNRVDAIVNQAEELKSQMQAYRNRIETQKEEIEHRRRALANERLEHEKQKPRAAEPVQAVAKKATQRLEKTHNRIVECRRLLCYEAGTSSHFQRRKGSNGRSEYTLGGIIIPDLKGLNVRTQHAKNIGIGGRTVAEQHDLVSEAFDNVARLVNLTAHYLSVRLPAEIILPHEDFPRAVIMTQASSYKFKNVPFPGLSGSQSSSPAASRTLERDQPRPRMLWLDRPLAQLVKDDPKTYGLFIEGVTLLAWDIAWLCKTQGIENITTFEDICSIGKNLWQLLGMQSRKSHQKSAKDQDEKAKEVRLGGFSHATARHNLAGAEGLELLKDWKTPSTSRLMDKLKSYLLTEISGAEWDLLEEQEWDEEREDEKPVLIGGSRRPHESKHVAMSVMNVAPHEDNDISDGKQKGNSGWMKVRGRNQAS